MSKRKCRVCGCTDNTACYHSEHGYCWWEEPDLCSHCQMIAQGDISLEEVERCCSDDDDYELRFQKWVKMSDVAKTLPLETLRKIFDAMDDEENKILTKNKVNNGRE